MNVHLPAPRRGWAARLVILAVVVVVLALAAATFVLSYTGVHEIALQADVSSRLARVYPGTFDAVLVIACAGAVVLRDAHWLARSYAWLSIILVVAVVGAADAVHAMNVVLPHRQMEGVVAAAPWVLALLGFSLLLTILQQTRAQHTAAAPESRRAARRAEKQGAVPPATDEQAVTLVVPGPAAPETDAAAEHRLDEPAAAVSVGEAQSYPVAEISASAEDSPALESGGQVPSWHQYWDTEETGPVPHGFPAPAAEAIQHGYPSPQADVAEPPDPAAITPATDLTYPGAAPADPGERGYGATEGDPSERGYRAADSDLGDGTYWAAEADPSQGTYPAAEADPSQGTYRAAEPDSEEPYPTSATETGPSYPPAGAPQPEDDAPPFATAPFATIPRLNRVRSSPTPPEADEE
jgi:Protein of unknown function (DUF2637)